MFLHLTAIDFNNFLLNTNLSEEIKNALDWFASLNLPTFDINALIYIFCISALFVSIIGGKVKFGPLEIESKGIGEFLKSINEARKHFWDSRQKKKEAISKSKSKVRIIKKLK